MCMSCTATGADQTARDGDARGGDVMHEVATCCAQHLIPFVLLQRWEPVEMLPGPPSFLFVVLSCE